MRSFTLLCGLLAAVPLFAAPAVRAETLLIRNDTRGALTVQAACVVNGMVRPQRPVLVQPGGATQVNLPGSKLISVYDPRLPNRTLCQETLNASPQDQAFAIVPDGPGKVKLEAAKAGP